ncbi:hypothetical protein ncot_10645 [Nocardioides sp. JQ2195]|uniref:hypothetical protein n=1 Tax=Nocardioides sp. JQ2195 TaxID=2592334 RepID=UPI00143E6719|nr:hypothetical protein [Nocardioides sp. JQ2195]QIX27000.1 hypothetical protein ncot_10645 [Nocardioides sp. JQ2195]
MPVSDDSGFPAPLSSVEHARWIAETIAPGTGIIRNYVPTDLDGVARVLHRAGHDYDLTWKRISAASGETLSSDTQFDDIRQSLGEEPPAEVGSLDPVSQERLTEILTEWRATQASVFFGWWTGSAKVGRLPGVHGAPAYRGPRECVLFESEFDKLAHLATEVGVTPYHWFDASKSWLVVTELDFDSTLVAGPSDLIDAITSDTVLEAFETSYSADLRSHRP